MELLPESYFDLPFQVNPWSVLTRSSKFGPRSLTARISFGIWAEILNKRTYGRFILCQFRPPSILLKFWVIMKFGSMGWKNNGALTPAKGPLESHSALD